MIPHSRPDVRRSDFAYVARLVRTRQIARGPLVTRLERAFVRATGTRYASATSSGTAALHLGLRALGVGAGDEVLLPSFTCAAVWQAVRHAEATPRLVDIDPESMNVTVDTIRPRLSRRTKALIVTHSFGFPASMQDLVRLGITVVEDCALALGASYRGRPVGSLGALSVFSMYATKVVCAGEGGMVCTNDARIAARIRDLNRIDERHDLALRFNYKLSDLAAGLALSQLRRLPQTIAWRRRLAARYRGALAGTTAELPRAIPGARPNYYRFLVRTPRASAAITRARRLGIGCDRPVFRPLHRYLGGPDARRFPGTETAFATVFSVPLYPALTSFEVARIVHGLRHLVSAEASAG